MDVLDLEFLQDKKDVILSNWVSNKILVSIFNKNDINLEYFKNNFADNIIDYVLSLEDKVCIDINETIEYFIEKKLDYQKIVKIIEVLKNILFEILLFSQENISEDIVIKFYQEIPQMSEKLLREFICSYIDEKVENVNMLLDNYKYALNISNIVSKTDPKGIITYVNDEFCRISGFSKEELIGKSHNIVRHPDTQSNIFANLWETIKSKQVWKGRIKNKTKSGGFYIVDATVIPILDAKRKIVEYISVRKDVTDYFSQCDMLKDYKMAVDVANIVSITDLSGKIKYVNDAFCDISGYTREELIGKPHNMVRHPEMPKEAFANLWDTVQRGKVWHGRVKNLRKDGGYYVVDATVVPIKENSKIVEYISIRKDITELERQKDEIARMKAKQLNEDVDKAMKIGAEKIISMLPLPTIIINENDTIIEYNDEFLDLFDVFDFEEMNTKIKDKNASIFEIFKNFDFHSSWKETLDMFNYDFTIELTNDDGIEYKIKIKKSSEDNEYMITFY